MALSTKGAAAIALAVAVGSLTTFVAAAPAASARCTGGYAYAGVVGTSPARGVAATLTAVAAPALDAGHVAAWVGVGGKGLGAHGADEWIQAGLSREPGGGLSLYREVTRPGAPPAYTRIATAVVGRRYRVAVAALADGRWTVTIDGRRTGAPVHLAGSAGWRPVATAESWLPAPASCNAIDMRFDRVAALASAHWRPLTAVSVVATAHYGLVRQNASFSARLR